MTIKDIIKQIPFRELSLSRGEKRLIDKGISLQRKKDILEFINLILKGESIISFIMSESTFEKDIYNICIITNDKFINIKIVYDTFRFHYDEPIMGECINPPPNSTNFYNGYCRAEIYDLYTKVCISINKDICTVSSPLNNNQFLLSLNLDLKTNKENINFLKLLQSKLIN